jgi:hypothetical protein
MGLGSFNKQSRPGLFRRLSGGTLDLLVIGGGITGASVFRDAALRERLDRAGRAVGTILGFAGRRV